MGKQQSQQAALLPLAPTQERKSSPGRHAKRGKEQIAPVPGKDTNSGSGRGLAASAHPQSAQGLQPASTQLSAKDIRGTSQQGHAVPGAQDDLPTGTRLPAAILDGRAKDQLHDRLTRLQKLRAEWGAAAQQKPVSGMQHAAADAQLKGKEVVTRAANAAGEYSGEGGVALQLEDTMNRDSASQARPAQASVSTSEISSLNNVAPAADTPATASGIANGVSQQQAWRRDGLLVDTRASAACFGSAQKSPLVLRRSRQVPPEVASRIRLNRVQHDSISRLCGRHNNIENDW